MTLKVAADKLDLDRPLPSLNETLVEFWPSLRTTKFEPHRTSIFLGHISVSDKTGDVTISVWKPEFK